MGRRKSSLIDDLLELAATVPWWIGLVLAFVAFLGLKIVADLPLPADAPAAGFPVRVFVRGVASAAQYFVPLLLVAGTLIGVLRRRHRGKLHEAVATSDKPNPLLEMGWQDFERLVSEYFRRQGFTVEETGGGGADGGIDVQLKRGNDLYLVQCKQWRARRVGVETVRELYGVMAARGAAGGFVVSAGYYTKDARDFASGREIALIDGEQLGAEVRRQAGGTPLCPQCSTKMVLRRVQGGTRAGSRFWGCPRFPACRGTRPFEAG